MKVAIKPDNEEQRIAEVKKYEILDTDNEESFDNIAKLVSAICGTPTALITVIDSHRQWFKSRIGFEPTETARDISFCAHAIHQTTVMEVPDALEDERFVDNPLVVEAPKIRFYAGAPLITSEGFPLGTLCAIDQSPRKLSDEQRNALEILSRQVVRLLELRIYAKKLKESQAIIEHEKEKSERLLLNTFPASIVQRLKNQETTIADRFEHVSVLFADIVGFTALSKKLAPEDLVVLLNDIFSRFDKLVDTYGLEKIKTIGDAYMVVGGLPEPVENHVEKIAQLALDMQAEINHLNKEIDQTVGIRIGIHTGSAVAGVIGAKKFIYDVWGDTVNTASRMESHGIPGQIQVSEPVYEALKRSFIFEERNSIEIKGKGKMQTYLLLGKKGQDSK